jgi:hypothetical protein
VYFFAWFFPVDPKKRAIWIVRVIRNQGGIVISAGRLIFIPLSLPMDAGAQRFKKDESKRESWSAKRVIDQR